MKKEIIDNINHCYATIYLKLNNERFVLFASEENDKCFAYSLDNNLEKKLVWENPGGTMTLVALDDNSFLATQKFYPGFNSKNTCIVKTTYENGVFKTKKINEFPYLHRFDVFEKNGKKYFIGCTICTSKKFTEDWSDPGKIYVGEYDEEKQEIVNIRVLKDGIYKNHGYFRKDFNCYIASESGIFLVNPPEDLNSDWKIEKLSDIKASDLVVFDINNDGKDEIFTIEKFHGNKMRVYEVDDNNNWNLAYEYPNEIDFAHFILGFESKKLGKTLMGGVRSKNKETFYINYINGNYEYTILDENVGASNGFFINDKGEEKIFVANREINEACLYKI